MSLSREEILRMATDAGLLIDGTGSLQFLYRLEELANAAYAAGAAAEREACAMVCDEKAAMQIQMIGLPVAPSMVIQKDRAEQFNKAAAAIRARGNGGEK